jgi:hypothetical protein
MNGSPSIHRSGGRILLSLAAWSLAAAGAMAASPPARAPAAVTEDDFGDVVTLSPYEVIARTGDFERWIKVGSPHFIIYTDARVKEAMTMLQRMEMLHSVAQSYLQRKAIVRAPMVLVLPTARSDWRRLASKGGVEWEVAMSGTGGKLVEVIVVQYDWQDIGPQLIWAGEGVSMMSHLNLDTTFWFGHGIASFFETAKFTQDTVTIGAQNPRTFFPMNRGWLPWQRFFEITATSAEFTKDSNVLHQYDGQCAAFIQFMLANPDKSWVGKLLTWNSLLEAGREPTEELFKETFGQDWKQWESTMNRDMKGGKYVVSYYRFKPEALELQEKQLPLTLREIRELFVLTQIMVQDVPESEQSLDALLARGLKAEALGELLVEVCLERRRLGDALEQLRKLIAAGSINPSVYAIAAGLALHRKVPEMALDARLGDEVTEIRAWCRRALELEPHQVVAANVLAWAEALGPEVDAANLASIGKICRELDGVSRTDETIAALAVARWRAGRAASARKACQTLIESPFTGKDAGKLARDLLLELDRAPLAAGNAASSANAAPAEPETVTPAGEP